MYLSNRRVDTRLFLWSIFLLQLFLICLFLLVGNHHGISGDENELHLGVKFIESHNKQPPDKPQNFPNRGNFFNVLIRGEKEFMKHFLVYQHNLNFGLEEEVKVKKTCFKEGTINNSRLRASDTNETELECKCRSEWHGSDCGQPEVIWRAFMTIKQRLQAPPSLVINKLPHKVFYIISHVSNVHSETLEVQIMELVEIVNLFVLCDLTKTTSPRDMLRNHVNFGFFKSRQSQILLLNDDTCSGKNIYRKMQKHLNTKGHTQMHGNDVLVYTKSDEILNKKAINYLRWYDHWPQPVKFRFKFNVYGFYFKHPESTIIGGMACQVNLLEEFYKFDPDLIIGNNNHPTALVIGDLNHFGGWYCKYCAQPIDIIKQLNLDSSLANKLNETTSNIISEQHPSPTVINIEYVQNLVASGLYIDGKTQLVKIRHYDESKYYTPEYIAKYRWKFDNILVNLFASWDDDLIGLNNNDYIF